MDSKVTEKYFVMPDGVKLYTRIIEPCDGKPLEYGCIIRL